VVLAEVFLAESLEPDAEELESDDLSDFSDLVELDGVSLPEDDSDEPLEPFLSFAGTVLDPFRLSVR
jgi:hypothetical protein